MVAAIEEIAKVARGNGRSVVELWRRGCPARSERSSRFFNRPARSAVLAGELESSLTFFQDRAHGFKPPTRSRVSRSPMIRAQSVSPTEEGHERSLHLHRSDRIRLLSFEFEDVRYALPIAWVSKSRRKTA